MTDKIDEILDRMREESKETAETVAEDVATKAVDKGIQKYMQNAPAVHTESRTSEWLDYRPSKEGRAFVTYVATGLRAIQRDGDLRNLASHAPDETFAKRFIESMNRAAPIGHGSDGGDQVLEQPLYQEVDRLLRERLVLDALGITRVPMTSKTLDLPRETDRASFAYTAESATIDESQYDFDQKQLVAKKLAGRVGMTNDWLEMNPIVAAEWIAARMIEDFAVTLEEGVIEGLAGGPEPLFDGIDAGNKFELTEAAGTSSDFAEFDAKIDEAVEACVVGSNVREEDVRILMNTKTKNMLRRQFQNSAYRYRELREDGTLADFPVVISNHIGSAYDDSSDGDNDETRIFVGDFSNYWLGMLTDMKLDFSEHSRFAQDESEYKLVGHHDGLVKRGDRIAVLSTDIDG